jgi:hypothetical protein
MRACCNGGRGRLIAKSEDFDFVGIMLVPLI